MLCHLPRGMTGDSTPAAAADSLPDAFPEPALESPPDTRLDARQRAVHRRPWADRWGKPKRVDRARRRFSLLVVRGDGVRVMRFNFPRPLVVGSFTALFVATSVNGLIFSDYVKLRRLTREAASLERQVYDNRATFNAMNRRMAELRDELSSWREIQARVEQPFGPDASASARGRERGIGGPVTREPRPVARSPLEELNLLADAIAEQDASLRTLDRLMARAGKALASLPSTWPIRGAVASEFGTRKDPWGEGREFHPGLDIGAHPATPVLAPADATVTFAGAQPEYGTMVILDHGQQVRSLYGHLSRVAVKPGQRVERGTVIGYSGNTGRSSGPHLHYEVQVRGQAVNPRTYLFN